MSKQLPGKNFLLAVAIDKYKHIRKLNNSVRDADAVVQMLTVNYRFEAANITRLYNSEATEKDIYRELKRLAVTLLPEDNLVIYFAGHGVFDDITGEGFWIPVAAEEGEEGDYVGNDKILRYLSAIKARHIFLLSDACFSGSLFANVRSALTDRLEKVPSRWALTSGRNEVVSDGPPGKNSPFAESLLEILEQKKHEHVTASQIVQYVKEQVAKATDGAQVPQGGPLFLKEDKGGEFVFHPRAHEAKKNITRTEFSVHEAALVILYSDITRIEAEVMVSSDDEMISMSGGVSEHIRKAAGEAIFRAAQEQTPAKLGEVIVTPGGDSLADYIFHAITIDHESGERVDADMIEIITKKCLEAAEELGIKSIVFPALGTGAARADFEEVASAMVDTIGNYLLKTNNLAEVTIALKGRRGVNTKSDLYRFYQKATARAAIINQVAETYANLRELQNRLRDDNDIFALLPLIKEMQSELGAVQKIIENKQNKPGRKQSSDLKVLMSALTDKAFTINQTANLFDTKKDLMQRTNRSLAQTIGNLNRVMTNKIKI